MKQFLTLLICFSLAAVTLPAQDISPLIKRYLLDNQQKLQLNKDEASSGWQISDQYVTKHNQVTQVYVQQMLNGLKIYNAISSAAIKDGAVTVFNSRFVPNAATLTNVSPGMEQIDPRKAVELAAQYLKVPLDGLKEGLSDAGAEKSVVFTANSPVSGAIKVQLLYFKTEEDIHLAWNVEIQSKSDWWHVRIDAMTGKLLDKGNYTVYCNFKPDAYKHLDAPALAPNTSAEKPVAPESATAVYRIFPFPGESPNHINRQLVSDPSDPLASPFGWHDTDGQAGADFTITRGNNVYAAEDRDDNNQPGYSPDGGSSLTFDFPYNPIQAPIVWEDAAITNLFYANNFIHDMTYHHGFDEAAGNFQENNYGHGGQGDDAVQADAQDGSGTDNANFSTPPDGNSGRMQMYIWTGGGSGSSGDSMTVNFPPDLVGLYYAPAANFGPLVSTPLTGDVVLVVDDTAPTSDGCQTIVNSAQLAGKIALVDRGGSCNYVSKVKKAQDAGAIAVLVANNTAAGVFTMPGTSTDITIPSVMISQADGLAIRNHLVNDGVVNITILPTVIINNDRDSDLDNGIIAHEYGHGISNRLTGGPSNTGCLNNAEQMGEGWSDFYALITTIHPTDTRDTRRPIGTYAIDEPVTGPGIRHKVYTTDMSVNSYTYADLPGTGGEVHDIGEVWATMLWDLTWDLIDLYGFEPDLTAATGGNNIAQRLVTDGFKLQACSPGFVDGRDGILQADMLDFNGANQCLIWEAFARRGLGYSANQGSSQSTTDGTAAFDLPPLCQTAVLPPVAAFTADHTSRCLDLATFHFTDQSQNLAQYLLWDFGDGTTSTESNPTHTYTAEGTYTITLTVTNNIGSNTLVRPNYISVVTIPPLTVNGTTVCAGQSATLTATPGIAGNTAEWSDAAGNVLYTGTTFNTPVLTATTTFSVNEAELAAIEKVGPVDFGTGSFQNSQGVRQVLFTADKPFTIKSVLLRAQGAGDREIRLYDATGTVIAAVTVNVPDGESRVPLNIKVPVPGDYALGAGPNVNLFRTTEGVVYPFKLDNLVTITGSNAGGGRYYYFYDWEVQPTPCRSATSDVTVNVTPGPVANFSFVRNGLALTFTNQTTGNPTSWSWNFGDGGTSTALNPAHTYATVGVYTIELTVTDGNCTHVYSQTIDFTTGTSPLQADLFSVRLAPNPASGYVNLTLIGTPGSRKVQVGLYGADGRLVQNRIYDAIQGIAIPMDLSDVAPGMYVVKVEAAAGIAIHKLVVH